jgi:hypothetical protein
MATNPKIEFVPVGEEDFRKSMLGGETKPHDVELILRFRDGKTVSKNIKWEDIHGMYERHNICMVSQVYEMLVEKAI